MLPDTADTAQTLVMQHLAWVRGYAQTQPECKRTVVRKLVELAVSLELGVEATHFVPDARGDVNVIEAMQCALVEMLADVHRGIIENRLDVQLYFQDHWLSEVRAAAIRRPDVENGLHEYRAHTIKQLLAGSEQWQSSSK